MKAAVIFLCLLSALLGVISGDSCSDVELGESCPADFSVIETIFLFPFSVMTPPPPRPPKPGGYLDIAVAAMTDGMVNVAEMGKHFLSTLGNSGWHLADTCAWLENALTVVGPGRLSQLLVAIQELGSNAYNQKHEAFVAVMKQASNHLAVMANVIWSKVLDLKETSFTVVMQDVTSAVEAAVEMVVAETTELWDMAVGLWRQADDQVGVPVLYSLLTAIVIATAAISSWRSRISKLNRKLELMSAAKANTEKRRKFASRRPKKALVNPNHDLLFEAMADDDAQSWAEEDDRCTLWLAHGDSLEDITPPITRKLSPIIETKESYSDPRMETATKTIRSSSPLSKKYSDRSASPIRCYDFEHAKSVVGESFEQQQRARSASMFANDQVDLMNITEESDIGEPCCNSSFIEDMEKRYGEIPICYSNGMGDGVQPAKHRPKGILTKRWPKQELGMSFKPDTSQVIDETDHTADTNCDVEDEDSQIDLSALSKSLSLYGGETMPLQEMAVVFVVQSLWNWAKKYIRKRSNSASRPSSRDCSTLSRPCSRDCSRLSNSFQQEHNHSKQFWKTHNLNNSQNQNKSQNCMEEIDSEIMFKKQASSSNYCSPPEGQECQVVHHSGSVLHDKSQGSAQNREKCAGDSDCSTKSATKDTDSEGGDSSGGQLLSFSDPNDLDDEIITGDSNLYSEYCCPNIQNARIVHVPLIKHNSESPVQTVDTDFRHSEEDILEEYEADDSFKSTDYDTDKTKMTQLLTDLNLLEELTGRDRGYLDEIEDIFENQNAATGHETIL